jgi:hypothetical protein
MTVAVGGSLPSAHPPIHHSLGLNSFAASISASTRSLYSAGHDRFGRGTSVSSAPAPLLSVLQLAPGNWKVDRGGGAVRTW